MTGRDHRAATPYLEPPGETHTLVVPEDVSEMATLFHVTGGYTYVDPQGVASGYEDVFTKLEAAKAHLRADSCSIRSPASDHPLNVPSFDRMGQERASTA